jgi:hypothetical protein
MDRWWIALRATVPLMMNKRAAAPLAQPDIMEKGEASWHSKQL